MSEEAPSSDVSHEVKSDSVRSCLLSAQQLYERFEKLPMERRKEISQWAVSCNQEPSPLLLLPKADLGAGRPEKWRVAVVDKQRFVEFSWKKIVWIAINSSYQRPEDLVAAAMAVLDTLAIPLNFLSNRYEYAQETVCLDVPVRFGLVMQFIRAQSKATASELAGHDGGTEEKEVREAWLADGLSMDDYRAFALQMFQVRQERDPPFVLMVFRGKPEKIAVVWFRDVHLAVGPFYKGLFPAAVEHLFWPNFNHSAALDPPLEVCERAGCTNCSGLVTSDERLLVTFVKHKGPWRKAGEAMLKARMKQVWESKYLPQLEAARKESKLQGDELEAKLGEMQQQLEEQLNLQEKASLIELVEAERCVRPFKKCGRCKLVKYCCGACQKDDWVTHGRYCVERGK